MRVYASKRLGIIIAGCPLPMPGGASFGSKTRIRGLAGNVHSGARIALASITSIADASDHDQTPIRHEKPTSASRCSGSGVIAI